jgi:hypothetical protein
MDVRRARSSFAVDRIRLAPDFAGQEGVAKVICRPDIDVPSDLEDGRRLVRLKYWALEDTVRFLLLLPCRR